MNSTRGRRSRRLLRIGLATALAVGALGLTGTASEAHVPMPSSFEVVNCAPYTYLQRSWPYPGLNNTFSVPGNGSARVPDGWRPFWPGDVVRISASGYIHAGGFLGWAGEHTPDGNGEPAPSEWSLPGAPKYSLVGAFNDTTQSPVFLGRGPRCLRWNGTNHHDSLFDKTFLNLRFNDERLSYYDNTGSFSVVVEAFFCNDRADC